MRALLDPLQQRILSREAQVGGVLQDEGAGFVGGHCELPARAPHDWWLERGQEGLDESRRVGLRSDEEDVRTRAE